MIQNRGYGPGYIKKPDPPVNESFDGDLVRGAQYGGRAASRPQGVAG